MWIRSCGLCREAAAEGGFLYHHNKSIDRLQASSIHLQFLRSSVHVQNGKKGGRFLNVRLDSMLGTVVRLGSIPSVNNSRARKFSLLSENFLMQRYWVSPPLFQFFFCFLYIVIYITYTYIIYRLETCNYIHIYVHTGSKTHCNGQRMLNLRDLAVILKRLSSMRSSSHY